MEQSDSSKQLERNNRSGGVFVLRDVNPVRHERRVGRGKSCGETKSSIPKRNLFISGLIISGLFLVLGRTTRCDVDVPRGFHGCLMFNFEEVLLHLSLTITLSPHVSGDEGEEADDAALADADRLSDSAEQQQGGLGVSSADGAAAF